TFVGLEKLPHTSALITNLADELPLVDRMQDAIHGELVRRQELLRATGYASLLDYERARNSGVTLEPMPTLFLVIDEFSELLAVRRDFINLFVMVGRLGRSLGVHLLLATQRIEEGRVNALEGHLSYRIGLKTFSASESRSVLGVTDAFETPLEAGMGFLKTTQSSLQKFRGAYVSGALPPESVAGEERIAPAVRSDLFDFIPTYVAPPEPEEDDESEKPDEPVRDPEAPIAREDVMMNVLIDRLKGSGPDAHRVWLPPLTTSTPLNQLVGAISVDPRRGFCALKSGDRLRVPVGIIDKPFEQRWDTLEADLGGPHGNVGIVGGPHSGKSTMLRTLILSLCLVNTPQEVSFYCLDFSSGSLGSLAGLPHVGSVGNRRDSDLVTRTVLEVAAMVDRREAAFARAGIDSMADARRRRASGRAAKQEDLADVFLVVDGWLTVR
ncbi:MAG: FtsK/SpoIIIE domain-containing protein, partial [Angustibacter sp.]